MKKSFLPWHFDILNIWTYGLFDNNEHKYYADVLNKITRAFLLILGFKYKSIYQKCKKNGWTD